MDIVCFRPNADIETEIKEIRFLPVAFLLERLAHGCESTTGSK